MLAAFLCGLSTLTGDNALTPMIKCFLFVCLSFYKIVHILDHLQFEIEINLCNTLIFRSPKSDRRMDSKFSLDQIMFHKNTQLMVWCTV